MGHAKHGEGVRPRRQRRNITPFRFRIGTQSAHPRPPVVMGACRFRRRRLAGRSPLKRPKRAASFGKEAALIRLFCEQSMGRIPIVPDQKNMTQQMQQKIEKITGNMTVVTKISQ